jgi:hypothetical protein
MRTLSHTKQFGRRSKAIAGVGAVLLVLGIVSAMIWIFFPALLEPSCAMLLFQSGEHVAIHLPSNCAERADLPIDATISYFEQERKSRGLVQHSWILCDGPLQPATEKITATLGRQWLATYKPSAFQYRRMVIIFPFAQPMPTGSSRIVGEICLVPWRHYVSQIAGECNGKFAIWKLGPRHLP